jgi:hypothetical protein
LITAIAIAIVTPFPQCLPLQRPVRNLIANYFWLC